MLNDDNVLIRCPNGHELQTAKADMQKKLACPICNTVFTPAASQVSPGKSPGAPADPHVLDLAASRLGQPIMYPAYTKWMLASWIIFTLAQTWGAVQKMIDPSLQEAQMQNASAALGTMGLGCVVLVVGVGALVMQLMWIYRIHADARRAGQYNGASPGLALGLSFIPAFNYVWTALLMSRLAKFSASADDSGEPADTPAVKATLLNLVFGILLGCQCLVGGFYGGIAGYKSLQLAMNSGGKTPDPELQRQITEAATPPEAFTIAAIVLGLVAVCVYAWAVRKVEKSLYPRLGAIEP